MKLMLPQAYKVLSSLIITLNFKQIVRQTATEIVFLLYSINKLTDNG